MSIIPPSVTLALQQHGLHHIAQARQAKLQAAMRGTPTFVNHADLRNDVLSGSIPSKGLIVNSTPQAPIFNHHGDLKQCASSGTIPKKGLCSNHAPQVTTHTDSNSLHGQEEKHEERRLEMEPQHLSATKFQEWQDHVTPAEEPTNQAIEVIECNTTSQAFFASGLVKARMVTEESSRQILQQAQQVSVEERETAHEQKTKKGKEELNYQRFGCCIVVGALVILAITLGLFTRETDTIIVALTLSPSMAPSAAPTGHLDLLLADLPDYTQKSLLNSTTPQWKAFDWLSYHQNISSMQEWKKTQLFAVATFFFSFEGESWPEVIKDRWMDDTVDECVWFSNQFGYFGGNTYYPIQYEGQLNPCNTKGEFEILAMDNLLLGSKTPVVPQELALLTSLREMILPQNDIRAPLSNMLTSTLSRLIALDSLSLAGNHLTGQVPSEMGLMTHLAFIYLSWNALTGSLPSELARLSNTNYLMLSNNSFIGLLPSELGLMTNMEYLSLDENSFSGSLPSELGRMSNLTDLWLVSNNLNGSLPTELGMLTRMKNLYISQNLLSGSLPSQWGGMTNLNFLHAGSNFLTGPIPTELGDMKSLIELDMSTNSFSGTIPSELGQLTNLTYLDLSNLTLMTGPVPSELALMTSLYYLDLRGSSGLSGTIPAEFCHLQNPLCNFTDPWGFPYNCTLDFDCNRNLSLCGCDCPCSNGTDSNSTSNATDGRALSMRTNDFSRESKQEGINV